MRFRHTLRAYFLILGLMACALAVYSAWLMAMSRGSDELQRRLGELAIDARLLDMTHGPIELQLPNPNLYQRLTGNTSIVMSRPSFTDVEIDHPTAKHFFETRAWHDIEEASFNCTTFADDAPFFPGKWKNLRRLSLQDVCLNERWCDGILAESDHIKMLKLGGKVLGIEADQLGELKHLELLYVADSPWSHETLQAVAQSLNNTKVILDSNGWIQILPNLPTRNLNQATSDRFESAFGKLSQSLREQPAVHPAAYQHQISGESKRAVDEFESKVGFPLHESLRAYLANRTCRLVVDPIYSDLLDRPIQSCVAVFPNRTGSWLARRSIPGSPGNLWHACTYVHALRIGKTAAGEPLWIDLVSGQLLVGANRDLTLLKNWHLEEHLDNMVEYCQLIRQQTQDEQPIQLPRYAEHLLETRRH